MLTQNPWSISTTSWPWSSQRFLRLSMSSRSRAWNAMWFTHGSRPSPVEMAGSNDVMRSSCSSQNAISSGDSPSASSPVA